MTNKLRLKIITPQRVALDRPDIEIVTAPGIEGELGILPRHAPLFTRLKQGLIMYKVNSQKYYVGVESALMDVSENTITVLADNAILPEEADVRRAQEAKKAAEEAMQKKLAGTDFKKVEAEMRKALLELKLVEHTK